MSCVRSPVESQEPAVLSVVCVWYVVHPCIGVNSGGGAGLRRVLQDRAIHLYDAPQARDQVGRSALGLFRTLVWVSLQIQISCVQLPGWPTPALVLALLMGAAA